MTFEHLKYGYESWCAARDWSLGPSISPKHGNRTVLDEAEKQIEKLGLNKLGNNSTSGTIFEMESPWHAAVFLFRLQSYCIGSNTSHMIFRGQRRSSWGLVTSIDRLKDDKDAHFRAFTESVLFSTMMKNQHTDFVSFAANPRWNFELTLPLMAYFPVAQHHDIPTLFLDFTADPAVAVFFASRDESDADETASVYCYRFPLEGGKSDFINMSFVPPFITRPYLQKGIFTETTHQGDLKDKIPPDLEVRFPVRSSNNQFSVFRDGGIDILPDEDREILILRTYAKAAVSEFIIEKQRQEVSADTIQEFANKYCKRNEGLLRSIYKKEVEDPINLTARYVDEFEDMMYWFCYYPQSEGLGINLESLDIVARSNPEIVKMVISFYRWLNEMPPKRTPQSGEQRIFKERLIELFAQALRKAGIDPDAPVRIENWLPKS